jgi:hypothetical protein
MSQSRFYGKKLGRPTDHLHSSSLILNGFTVAYFCRSKARLQNGVKNFPGPWGKER